jgi:serine/threonine protein kinase
LKIAQAAIHGSGTEDIPLGPKPSSGSSVITDAGDQQFKRQKQVNDQHGAMDQTPAANQETTGNQNWTEPFLVQHKLNSEIFAALQETRDSREKGFLPRAQLDYLINPDSVVQELSKTLSQTLSTQYIRKCAFDICLEKEVFLQNGDKRIKSFRKIFALLVLVEKSESISLFLEEDVSDLDLPLASVKVRGLIELRRRNAPNRPFEKSLNCFRQWSPVRRKEFEEYQWTMLAPFFTQGQYNHVSHYVLKDHHILPYISTEDEDDKRSEYHGGFSRVFMVRIHKDHHNFHPTTHCDRGFAIKQLLQNDRSSFNREVNILKKFAGENTHPHVVSLLATYEQLHKFHLIFHRAEGNLFDYWEMIDPSPSLTYSEVLWMAKQCAGIAHGLSKLHKHNTLVAASSIPNYDKEEDFKRRFTAEKRVRVAPTVVLIKQGTPEQTCNDKQTESATQTCAPPIARTDPEQQVTPLSPSRQSTAERDARLVNEPYIGGMVRKWGRHGDLKPENILFFRDSNDKRGTLKISDFGEAELNSRWSKTKRRSRVRLTMTYRPPECDLQPKIIRQSYDMWCLGCVYMEFVTWMLGGVELWKQFGRERLKWDIFQSLSTDTFFEIVKNDEGDVRVMVKEAVTKVRILCYNDKTMLEKIALQCSTLVLRQATLTS